MKYLHEDVVVPGSGHKHDFQVVQSEDKGREKSLIMVCKVDGCSVCKKVVVPKQENSGEPEKSGRILVEG